MPLSSSHWSHQIRSAASLGEKIENLLAKCLIGGKLRINFWFNWHS